MTAATAQLIRTTTELGADMRLYAVNQLPLAHDRSAQMYLLNEELARDRIAQRRRDADAHRLVRTAVLARRAERKSAKAVSAKAVLRARLVALVAR
jgi:hypothetical protein